MIYSGKFGQLAIEFCAKSTKNVFRCVFCFELSALSSSGLSGLGLHLEPNVSASKEFASGPLLGVIRFTKKNM